MKSNVKTSKLLIKQKILKMFSSLTSLQNRLPLHVQILLDNMLSSDSLLWKHSTSAIVSQFHLKYICISQK